MNGNATIVAFFLLAVAFALAVTDYTEYYNMYDPIQFVSKYYNIIYANFKKFLMFF